MSNKLPHGTCDCHKQQYQAKSSELLISMPPRKYLQQTFSNCIPASRIQTRNGISCESSACRRFTCNAMPYLPSKIKKHLKKLSSAAVMDGALRVNKQHKKYDQSIEFELKF